MSDYSVIDSVDDIKEYDQFKVVKTEKKDDSKTITIIKRILVVLTILLVAEILIYHFFVPSLNNPHITFTGNKSYSEDYLNEVLTRLTGKNWFNFDVDLASSLVAEISGIESVSVEKKFPDKIAINIKERESIAMTFVNDNGRSVSVQIDKNGVLFLPGNNGANRDSSIPIVSGIPIEHFSNGMRIPTKYRILIEQIAKIRALPQKYFAAVSEICVVPKKYGNYELMLIPVNSRTRVLTDRSLTEEALQYMMVVLDVVNSIEPDVAEIDLRYGSVSYRTKTSGGSLE